MVKLRFSAVPGARTYLDVDVPEEWTCAQIIKLVLEPELGICVSETRMNRSEETMAGGDDWQILEQWQGFG